MTLLGSATVRRHAPTVHTVRWLMRQHLTVAAWAVAILVIAATAGTALVDRFWTVELSVVQFARQGFIWFPFSIAIITTTSFINVHVAAGMTRRALGRATLVTGLVMAAFYTVVMTVALQIERAAYEARGWPQQIVDDMPVFDDTSQVGWILVDLGLVFTAAQLCGLLVGIVYYRAGGWWGTIALPLTVGPILVMTPLLSTPLLDPWSAEARIPVAVALLVATALAYLVLLHRTQIRQVTT